MHFYHFFRENSNVEKHSWPIFANVHISQDFFFSQVMDRLIKITDAADYRNVSIS